jgi:enamine deaminase RidA (YjgF/YER057c/UK114 family)
MPKCARHDDLIVVGGLGASAPTQAQASVDGEIDFEINRLRNSLAAHEASVSDLCHLRIFYVAGRGFGEKEILIALAKELKAAVRPAISFVPLTANVYHIRDLQLEALAVTRGKRREIPFRAGSAAHSNFAEAVSCGRFTFLSAVSASPEDRGDIVAESRSVMVRLEQALQQLGCGFSDVVKMNRWYLGSASKGNWEPSARAVAAFYQEPGPVATAIPLSSMFDDGALIRIELLAMHSEAGTPLPRSYSWPEDHWDWPVHLPYKHGLACDGLAFVGGQVSLDSTAEVIDPGNLRAQTLRSLQNISVVLEGLGFHNRDLLRLGAFYEVSVGSQDQVQQLLPNVPKIAIALPHLSYPNMLVEIEAMAADRH